MKKIYLMVFLLLIYLPSISSEIKIGLNYDKIPEIIMGEEVEVTSGDCVNGSYNATYSIWSYNQTVSNCSVTGSCPNITYMNYANSGNLTLNLSDGNSFLRLSRYGGANQNEVFQATVNDKHLLFNYYQDIDERESHEIIWNFAGGGQAFNRSAYKWKINSIQKFYIDENDVNITENLNVGGNVSGDWGNFNNLNVTGTSYLGSMDFSGGNITASNLNITQTLYLNNINVSNWLYNMTTDSVYSYNHTIVTNQSIVDNYGKWFYNMTASNSNCSVTGSCPNVTYLNYANTGDLNVSGKITGTDALIGTQTTGWEYSELNSPFGVVPMLTGNNAAGNFGALSEFIFIYGTDPSIIFSDGTDNAMFSFDGTSLISGSGTTTNSIYPTNAKIYLDGTSAPYSIVLNAGKKDTDTYIKSDASDNAFFVNGNSSRVGIGTNNPTRILDVRGNANFSGTVYINNETDISDWMYNQTDSSTYNATYDTWAYNQTLAVDTFWNLTGTNLYQRDLDYNVGIGTSTPDANLEVVGNATLPFITKIGDVTGANYWEFSEYDTGFAGKMPLLTPHSTFYLGTEYSAIRGSLNLITDSHINGLYIGKDDLTSYGQIEWNSIQDWWEFNINGDDVLIINETTWMPQRNHEISIGYVDKAMSEIHARDIYFERFLGLSNPISLGNGFNFTEPNQMRTLIGGIPMVEYEGRGLHYKLKGIEINPTATNLSFSVNSLNINNSLYINGTDGNVNMARNLNVEGNITGNGIYGGMWYHNHSGIELAFTNADTFYPLFFTNATHLNGFSYVGGYNSSSNLTTQVNGVYQATYMALGSGENNDVYMTTILVNDVCQPNCGSHKKMSAGGDVVTMAGTCFIDLNVGDNVALATKNYENTGEGIYFGGNLNLVRIGT